MLALDTSTKYDWHRAELGSMLRHQLDSPLGFDLGNFAPESKATLDASHSTASTPLETFGDLLRHPHPPLGLLKVMKEFAKANRDNPESSLPTEIATVIYFAAIVVALMRCGQRITELDDDALRGGVEWVIGQPWVDELTRSLFRDALPLIGTDGAEPEQGMPRASDNNLLPKISITGAGERHVPPRYAPQVEGYQIIGKLGEGGMGTVWRAVQLSTRREVALKLLSPAIIGSDKLRARFEREVELAASLEHPNIARVYDSGLRQGVYYYAMEFIDGLPLDEYVLQNHLKQRQILELMEDVCGAVQCAHQRGVIHTDLKPSNILVSKDGEPHVLDFGLAKSVQASGTGLATSVAGQVSGTAAYMSPEQAAGQRDRLDTRSDVYSLGVILYRSLTGVFPYDHSGGWQDVMRRISQEEPRRPSAASGEVDKELEALLLKCLAHDPNSRYRSAAHLAQDIANYLAGQPLLARPPTAAYFFGKWLRRYKGSLTTGAVAVVAVAGMAVGSYIRIAQVRSAAVSATSEAELRYAESLVSQGDVLVGAQRGDEARARYMEANGFLKRLGHPTAGAMLGLWDSYRTCPPPLNSFASHQGGVQCTSLSPDEKVALSGGIDGTVKLWEVASGRELQSFVGHRGGVLSVAFSPEGKFALSGDSEGTVKVWELVNGRELRSFVSHQGGVLSMAFSPDGKFALSGSSDGTVTLLEVTSGRKLQSFVGHLVGVLSVAFSPDGKFALSGDDEGTIKLWETTSGRELRSFASHEGGVRSVAFSPDGKFALSGDSGGAVKLWDTASGQEFHSFASHQSGVLSVAFSPDGKFALSGDDEGTIKLWETTSGRELRSFAGYQGAVLSVAFSHDGKVAVSSGLNGTAKLWKVASGGELRRFGDHQKGVLSVAFSPDAKLALSGDGDGSVKVWETTSGRELRSFASHEGGIRSVAFSPRGKLALSGGIDGPITLWEVASGRELCRFIGHQGTVFSVAFSRNGKLALSGGSDGKTRVWDVASGREVNSFASHEGGVLSVAFSPDGKFALSGGSDGIVSLWEVASSRELRSFGRHQGGVLSVAFSPDEKFMLSGDSDGIVMLWELASGKELHSFVGHRGGARSVAFSLDGKLALSGGADGTVRIWELASGREVRSLASRQRGVLSAAFSLDGKLALSGGSDGTVTLLDFSRADMYQTFNARLPGAFGAIHRNPNDPAALAVVGNWYAFRGAEGWAVEFLENARRGGAAVSSLTLARCYWELNRFDEAKEEFHRALEAGEAPEPYLRLCLEGLPTANGSESKATR
jgi:WD40 repeat protein/predicted Ser/Thr protein kinase